MRLVRPLVVLLALAVTACTAGNAPRRDPDTLVALARTDGATMNPLYASTVQDGSIYAALLFDGLTYIGADYAPHPGLATRWTPSADGTRWVVDLRRGVRWSDGAPFTSADVAFTYKTMTDPKVAYIGAGDLDYVKSVTPDGPQRVRFVLTHPSARFVDAVLGQVMLPQHVLGAIRPERQQFSAFGEHPVGTGPYRLQSWQHDSEVVFVRNPHYWHGTPKIARIDFRIIFNDQAETEALENGSADLIEDLGFTQYKRLQRNAPNVKILTYPSLYVDTIEVNLQRPGLSDVAVRQAMMYGQDRAALTAGFFDGRVDVADNIVPVALKRWYEPNVQRYPYDPARARALLDRAGWKPGPDGIRRKGKTRLSFELLLNVGSAVLVDETLAFTADMRAIGIDVALRQLDFPSMSARTYVGKYDLLSDARGGAIDPDWTTVLASTARVPNGANTTGFNDPAVDRDLALGVRTLDYARRRQYYSDMQKRLAVLLPMLWQYTRFSATAYAPRLQLDPRVTLQSPLIWYNVNDWTLHA